MIKLVNDSCNCHREKPHRANERIKWVVVVSNVDGAVVKRSVPAIYDN